MIVRDPDETRRKLFEIAERQAGHFTAAQAVEAGYSHRLHNYHARKGHWLRIDRGIYRLRDFPATPHGELVRWDLWSRGEAVVSCEVAAALHDLGDVMPGRVHLTVSRAFGKKAPPGVVLHHADLDPAETESHGGFRSTSPTRTILDLARDGMEADRLAAVLRDALVTGAADAGAIERSAAGMELEHQDRLRRAFALVRGGGVEV